MTAINLSLPTIDLRSPNWNVSLAHNFNLIDAKLDEMADGIQGDADRPFSKLVNNDSVTTALALADTHTDDEVNARMHTCEKPHIVDFSLLPSSGGFVENSTGKLPDYKLYPKRAYYSGGVIPIAFSPGSLTINATEIIAGIGSRVYRTTKHGLSFSIDETTKDYMFLLGAYDLGGQDQLKRSWPTFGSISGNKLLAEGVGAATAADASWQPVIGDMLKVTNNDGTSASYWITAVSDDELTLDSYADPVIGPNWAIYGYREPYISVVEYDEDYHYDPGVIIMATVVNGTLSVNSEHLGGWGWNPQEIITGVWASSYYNFASAGGTDARNAGGKSMVQTTSDDIMINPIETTAPFHRSIITSIDRSDGSLHVRSRNLSVRNPATGLVEVLNGSAANTRVITGV